MGNIRGNLSLTLITMFFIASTLFGLMHYWNEAAGLSDKSNGLDQSDPEHIVNSGDSEGFDGIISIFSSGFFDWVLNALSWASPFALVKVLVLIITSDTPEIYAFLDYFLLRPVGWVSTFIFFEWTAYLIRGKGF